MTRDLKSNQNHDQFRMHLRTRIMQIRFFKVIQVKVWQATVTFSLSYFNSIFNELTVSKRSQVTILKYNIKISFYEV